MGDVVAEKPRKHGKKGFWWPKVISWLRRAMDFLYAHQGEVEQELYFHTANLVNLNVDLIFYDTTSVFWETEAEYPGGLRKRGNNKDSRPDAPQIIVGLAVTRDGYPVCYWVFCGSTADISSG